MGRSYIRYGLRMSEVQIVEVSPRDGLQNESRLVSTEHKAQLVRRALDAGLDDIDLEVTTALGGSSYLAGH